MQNSRENNLKTMPDKESSRHSTYTSTVHLLLQKGAQIDGTNSEFNPATAHLKPTKLIKPNTDILKMLLAAGAEIKEDSFLSADTDLFGSEDTLIDMTRKSIRKQLKEIHPERNLYFTIPKLGLPRRLESYLLFHTPKTFKDKELLSHTLEEDIDNVQSLIQAGVDVNVQDENGMTALMIASQTGHLQLAEELIRAKADMDIKNKLGDTALICATKEKRTNCVKKLLEFGANINIPGANDQTALFYAASKGNKDCLKALIEKGADLNIKDEDGRTALANYENFDALKILVDAGAEVNLAAKDGRTALHKVASDGDTRGVKKLIEAGAGVNSDFGGEFTALMSAAEGGKVESIKELIAAGADVNFKTKDGRTALTLAAENNFSDCVSMLYKAGAEVNTAYLASIVKNIKVATGIYIYLVSYRAIANDLKLDRSI